MADDQQAVSPTESHGTDELFDTPPKTTERDDRKPRLQFSENAASPSKTYDDVTPDNVPLSNGNGHADAPATLTMSSENPALQHDSVEEPVRSKLE